MKNKYIGVYGIIVMFMFFLVLGLCDEWYLIEQSFPDIYGEEDG